MASSDRHFLPALLLRWDKYDVTRVITKLVTTMDHPSSPGPVVSSHISFADFVADVTKADPAHVNAAIASLYLDTATLHAHAGHNGIGWTYCAQAVSLLLGQALASTRHNTVLVVTRFPSPEDLRLPRYLWMISDPEAHVDPWIRVHMLLAAMRLGERLDESTRPSQATSVVRRCTGIMTANGLTGGNELLLMLNRLADNPARAASSMVYSLMQHKRNVPCVPGASPWTIAIAVHYLIAHGIMGDDVAAWMGLRDPVVEIS